LNIDDDQLKKKDDDLNKSKNDKDDNKGEKVEMKKSEIRRRERLEEERILNMSIEDKIRQVSDRNVISGIEILKDWKDIAESLEKIDNNKKNLIRE